MKVPPLTEEGVLKIGLEKQGLRSRAAPTAKQIMAQIQNLHKYFGGDPMTCLDLWKAVQTVNTPAHIPKACIYDLLMTVQWLQEYDTVFKTAVKYGLCEPTASDTLWPYTFAIQSLKEKNIKWLWSNQVQDDEVIIVSVDGIHCMISEPRTMPSSKWYSHKTHGPALSYKIAIAIQHNKIVYVNGPFPAGVPDITMYRQPGSLKSKMADGKYATADLGYLGEKQLRTPNDRDNPLAKSFKKHAQAWHETFNSRLKSFKTLEHSISRTEP
jgi:hypothetical protein